LLAVSPIVNHVVEDQAAMDGVFHALASQPRRDMVARLAAGPLTVGQLAAPLAMSLAAAAKHVQVLERAGLIHRTVDGRRHICRLDPAPLASAQAWLAFYERHWRDRLDALEDLFRPAPPSDPTRPGSPIPHDDREQ
jgi:DNA-binding transcriptional ArsR family regulator